jgi:uncharacterized protein YceK
MHKTIVVLMLMVFLAGCSSFTHTTENVNYATFALKRHKKIRDKHKDMVVTVTVPGDVAKAQSVVRRAARRLDMTEQEPRKREQHFLFFTNMKKKFKMKLGQGGMGMGTKNSADNNIGAFFYPVKEYNVTTVVLTEERYNFFSKPLRDQMVSVVKEMAPI